MTVPEERPLAIDALCDMLLPDGRTRVGSITQDICSWCGKPATEFTDTLSKKEYTISGFCQSCQDGEFLPEEEE